MSVLEEGKILVTGGCGFIGSAIIWGLNQMGIDNILVTDQLNKSDKFKNLTPLYFDDYMEADLLLRTLDRAPNLLEDIKVIFHLGACSSTTETNSRFLITNNYGYSKRMAQWARIQGIRFVYASSAATYGDGSKGMDDEDEDLSQLRPLNMYAYSKHLFDRYLQRRGWISNAVGIKYFNVFGPNEGHKDLMRSMVHNAFHQIKERGCVRLFKSYHADYPDGEQKRDFLYIKDAVAMTLHLAKSPKACGLFNVGSGRASSWLDLIRPVFEAMQRPMSIDFIDMPASLRDKYQYYTCAKIDKLRSTGYQAPISKLSDSVSDYVKNYLVPNLYLGDGLGEKLHS